MKILNSVSDVKVIKFEKIKSRNVNLDILSNVNDFFKIKRIFTVKGEAKKNDNKRGYHAHKNCEQIITCPFGEIQFKVFDGKNKRYFNIKDNNKAIFVPNYIWTETIYLKSKTTLVCYCSNLYDEKSYIRDMKSFINFRKTKK